MSSTAPSSSAPAHATSGGAQQTQGTARAHARHASGQAGTADLFASLLSLLSATSDAPLDATATDTGLGSEDPATTDAQALMPDGSHPLAGLLGWPGTAGQLPAAGSGQGSTSASTATGRDIAGLAARAGMTGAEAAGTPGARRLDNGTRDTALSEGQAPLPDGMTLLRQPETPDADTLAALGQATTNAASDSAQPFDPSRPYTPVRVTAWRSTAGWSGHGPAGHVSGPASASAGAPASSRTGQDAPFATQAATARSTVTLDERFAPANNTSISTADERDSRTEPGERTAGHAGREAGTALADAGSALASGSTGQDGTADQQAQNPASAAPGDDPTAARTADNDDLAGGHWGAQHLRHASLRVGEAGEQAIDIQLSMAGQEVRVDIRTDDAQARASLAQDGGASLGDLLQRSGIQLGGLSVGGQAPGQDGQGQHAPAMAPAGGGQRSGAATGADASTERPAAPPRPRADGSRPLDLFV